MVIKANVTAEGHAKFRASAERMVAKFYAVPRGKGCVRGLRQEQWVDVVAGALAAGYAAGYEAGYAAAAPAEPEWHCPWCASSTSPLSNPDPVNTHACADCGGVGGYVDFHA